MKLITQAQFNTSHSAILKILEYHNWSAAKHILFYRSKQDEDSSQCTMHKGTMKDLTLRAFLSLDFSRSGCVGLKSLVPLLLKMNISEHSKHANYFQANNEFKMETSLRRRKRHPFI